MFFEYAQSSSLTNTCVSCWLTDTQIMRLRAHTCSAQFVKRVTGDIKPAVEEKYFVRHFNLHVAAIVILFVDALLPHFIGSIRNTQYPHSHSLLFLNQISLLSLQINYDFYLCE